MKKIRLTLPDWRHLTVAQTASYIFYIIIGVSVLLFVLFRLVGFDMPYDENPDYNAPLLTGTLVGFMILLTVVALVMAVVSMVRSVRMNRGEDVVVNNVPARRISVAVAAATVLVLVLTFVFSSTQPLTVNGTTYADAFWLRTSGMLIATSLTLALAAIAAVVYGKTRNIRHNTDPKSSEHNAHKA